MASTVIRELIAKIGFKVDSGNLDKFDKSVTGLKNNLSDLQNKTKLLSAFFTATVAGLTALNVSTAKSIVTTAKLSSQIGVSANELKLLESAAQEAGFKTNELTDSMLRFSYILGQARISRLGINNEFLSLGINIQDSANKTKDIITLYREAAIALNKMNDPARKAAISYRLFGSSNIEITKFISQSNDALLKQIDSIRALSFAIDDNAIATSKRFIKAWVDTKTILTNIKNEIALQTMPAMEGLLNTFKDWFIINKDFIKQGIGNVIKTIGYAFKFLYNAVSILIPPIKKAIELIGGMENAINVLGYALGIILIPSLINVVKELAIFKGVMMALNGNVIPLMTSLVAGLGVAITALVVDDIAGWVAGNESAISRVLGDWEDFKPKMLVILDEIGNGFKESLTTIGDYGQKVFDTLLGNPITKIYESLSSPEFDKILDEQRGKNIDRLNDQMKDSGKMFVYDENSKKRVLVDIPQREERVIDLADESPESVKQGSLSKESLREDINDILNYVNRQNEKSLSRKRFTYDSTSQRVVGHEKLYTKKELDELEKSGLPLDAGLKLDTASNYVDEYNRGYRPESNLSSTPRISTRTMQDFNPVPRITNTNSGSKSAINNNVTQNINERITINVPAGTTVEQAKEITQQVASEVSRQFETVFLNGLNSIPSR